MALRHHLQPVDLRRVLARTVGRLRRDLLSQQPRLVDLPQAQALTVALRHHLQPVDLRRVLARTVGRLRRDLPSQQPRLVDLPQAQDLMVDLLLLLRPVDLLQVLARMEVRLLPDPPLPRPRLAALPQAQARTAAVHLRPQQVAFRVILWVREAMVLILRVKSTLLRRLLITQPSAQSRRASLMANGLRSTQTPKLRLLLEPSV